MRRSRDEILAVLTPAQRKLVERIRQRKGRRDTWPRRRTSSLVAEEGSECLTPRQSLVLGGVAEGHTNEEIADALEISVETVKTHLRHVFLRLDAKNRAHAIAIALRGKGTP